MLATRGAHIFLLSALGTFIRHSAGNADTESGGKRHYLNQLGKDIRRGAWNSISRGTRRGRGWPPFLWCRGLSTLELLGFCFGLTAFLTRPSLALLSPGHDGYGQWVYCRAGDLNTWSKKMRYYKHLNYVLKVLPFPNIPSTFPKPTGLLGSWVSCRHCWGSPKLPFLLVFEHSQF